jgi:hypothetical protein
MQFAVLFIDAIAISATAGLAAPIADAGAPQYCYAADGSI